MNIRLPIAAMPTHTPNRRTNNRAQLLLDAAASLFALKGYASTTVRDIAAAASMTPGAVYVHFPSKCDLLVEVYKEGVRRVTERIESATLGIHCPWKTLESALTAHLEAILDRSAYASVIIRVLPGDVQQAGPALAALRDGYESKFRRYVEALPLAPEIDNRLLRLLLLGALNHAPVWYSDQGAEPTRIAAAAVQLIRCGASSVEQAA